MHVSWFLGIFPPKCAFGLDRENGHIFSCVTLSVDGREEFQCHDKNGNFIALIIFHAGEKQKNEKDEN